MTSPGGQEVGRVSIRVVPDTSRFRKQLERDLKAIQRGLEVEIPVRLDTKGVLGQLRQLRRELTGMKGLQVNAGVTEQSVKHIETTTTRARTLRGLFAGIVNSVSALNSQVSKTAKVMKAPVTAVRNFREDVQALTDLKLDNSSTAKFFKNLQSGNFLNTDQIGRFRSSVIQLGATMRTVGNRAGRAFKGIGRGLADMDLSFRRVRRSSQLFVRVLSQGLSLLGKGLLSPITGLVGAFSNLSRIGAIVLAVIVAIPPVLGLIGGLLAGLPSLLLSFGAAAGVVALGIDGIKAAFEDFGSTIQRTRDQISAVFEEGLTPQAEALARTINQLAPELQGVAQGLVEMAQGFTNAVTAGAGLENIRIVLRNTRNLFAGLSPVVEQFTNTFLRMAAEGSKQFGLLVEVFRRFAVAFDDMINAAVRTGEFRKAIEGLAQVTDALLQGFVKLVDVGIKAMGELGGPLATTLTSIIDLLVAMMPALTALSGAFLQVFNALAKALIPVFNALSPLLTQFFNTIAQMLIPIIRALAPPLQALISFVLQLFQAFSPLFPVLATIANVLGEVLLTALNALSPVLPVITKAMQEVAKVINKALRDATPVLEEVAKALGDSILKAIESLAPVLPGLIESFLELIQAVLPLLPPLVELGGKILPIVIDVLGILLPPLIDLAKVIVDLLVPALEWCINTMQGVVDWMGGMARSVAEAGRAVINWFRDLPGRIGRFLSGAGKWLVNTGKNLIIGLWNGVVGKWNDFVNWLSDAVGGLIDSVLGWFGINSPSKVFRQIGEFLMQGLQLGVEDTAPDAVRSVEDVAKQITGIGTGMSTEVTASGGLTLMSDNIQGAIERGIEGWQFELNKFGIGRLNRSAERDNEFGR